jgi:hypothetical protein
MFISRAKAPSLNTGSPLNSSAMKSIKALARSGSKRFAG